jgi:hypothetical protein
MADATEEFTRRTTVEPKVTRYSTLATRHPPLTESHGATAKHGDHDEKTK